jgi:hypothetical protein
MHRLTKIALAIAIAAGIGGTAVAAAKSAHVKTVPLPDGSVVRVEYVGDVAPQVTVAPVAPVAIPQFGLPAGFGDPAFGGLFEQMDRQMAATMRQIDQLARQPLAAGAAGANPASYGSLPPGTSSYSMVTVSENGHQCSRSTQVIGQGPGKPPKVVSNVSGDCGSAPRSEPAARAPSASSGPVHES